MQSSGGGLWYAARMFVVRLENMLSFCNGRSEEPLRAVSGDSEFAEPIRRRYLPYCQRFFEFIDELLGRDVEDVPPETREHYLSSGTYSFQVIKEYFMKFFKSCIILLCVLSLTACCADTNSETENARTSHSDYSVQNYDSKKSVLFKGTELDPSAACTINSKEFKPSLFCSGVDDVFFSWNGSVYSYDGTVEKSCLKLMRLTSTTAAARYTISSTTVTS